jgi:hypothetical protein
MDDDRRGPDDDVRTVSGDLIEPRASPGPGGDARRGVNDQLRVTDWSWSGSLGPGRIGLWLGIGLVVLGGFLVAREFLPGIDTLVDSVALVAGIAALAAWARDPSRGWLLYAGAVLGSLGLTGVLSALGVISGSGWGTLLLGLAFLLIALARWSRGGRWGWQLIVGGVVGLAGGVTVAGNYVPSLPSFGELLLAGALLLLGGWVLLRAARR